MPESAPVFPVSPDEVLTKLKESDLKSIEPAIVDFSWLLTAPPYGDAALVAEVFKGNAGWAENFFEIQTNLELQVYQDPENPAGVLVVSSSKNEVVTILKSRKRDLRDQIEIKADNIFVAEPTLHQAIDLASLLPKQERPVRFSMIAFEHVPEDKGTPVSNFGYSEEQNTFSLGRITDGSTLTSCCHEIGHVWADALGIDEKSQDQAKARRKMPPYVPEQDVMDRGWEAASKGISEVLFSERVANLIGKVIARKIEGSGVFSSGVTSILSRSWRDRQEANYDEYYLGAVGKKFPDLVSKLKQYFASRLNRTQNHA